MNGRTNELIIESMNEHINEWTNRKTYIHEEEDEEYAYPRRDHKARRFTQSNGNKTFATCFLQVKIWFQNRRMKWRNSRERAGETREQTLPNKRNPDLTDPKPVNSVCLSCYTSFIANVLFHNAACWININQLRSIITSASENRKKLSAAAVATAASRSVPY